MDVSQVSPPLGEEWMLSCNTPASSHSSWLATCFAPIRNLANLWTSSFKDLSPKIHFSPRLHIANHARNHWHLSNSVERTPWNASSPWECLVFSISILSMLRTSPPFSCRLACGSMDNSELSSLHHCVLLSDACNNILWRAPWPIWPLVLRTDWKSSHSFSNLREKTIIYFWRGKMAICSVCSLLALVQIWGQKYCLHFMEWGNGLRLSADLHLRDLSAVQHTRVFFSDNLPLYDPSGRCASSSSSPISRSCTFTS